MNGKDFSAAGLDKLTPAELEALNNWIRSHSVATLDQPKAGSSTADAGTDTSGMENKIQDEMDRSPIQSRLIGTFTGWDGKTVFKLENGMIWEQDDKDKYYATEVEYPAVTIKPGMFGRISVVFDMHENALQVPRSAIIDSAGELSVFVVEDGVGNRRIIETDFSSDGMVEVTSGINDGESVITVGHVGLKDESRVVVINQPARETE